MGELAAYSCPDLRHFLGGAESIKPCHKRGVQACGHGRRRGGHGRGGLSCLAFAFRLQDCPGHFFNKEGNAVRAFGNVLPNTLRELVEAVEQLTRALAQIAKVRATTPALRREQIHFQVALANALMLTKGYGAADTKARRVFRRWRCVRLERRSVAVSDGC